MGRSSPKPFIAKSMQIYGAQYYARNCMTTRTYKNVTPARYTQLLSQAFAGGATATEQQPGTSSTITAHGVTAEYSYDSADQILTVSITHKSFPASLVPDSTIFTELEKQAGFTSDQSIWGS